MLQIQVPVIPNIQILVEKISKLSTLQVKMLHDQLSLVLMTGYAATLVQFKNTRQKHLECSSSEGFSPFYFLLMWLLKG